MLYEQFNDAVLGILLPQRLRLCLARVQEFIDLPMPPHCDPVAWAESKNLVQNALPLESVDDIADQLQLFMLLVALSDNKIFATVVPLSGIALFIESEEEDIGVVITTEDVLVRIDESIGEPVAVLIEILPSECRRAEQVIERMHAAE